LRLAQEAISAFLSGNSYFQNPFVDVVLPAARGFSQDWFFAGDAAVSDVEDAIRRARRKEWDF